MRFVDRSEVSRVFAGKRVAVIGSGPSVLDNAPGFIDSHDVVVRVNNYKLSAPSGYRTDVHYSFYGTSIHSDRDSMLAEGVKLVMCKCPNDKVMESPWHVLQNKPHGVDFRYIYESRKRWWFCDTYVPDKSEFMDVFHLLGDHIPSTGFSAVLAVLSFEPEIVYMTGFDLFTSRVHNVNEPWRPGNPDDPIGHAPEKELEWLRANRDRIIIFDPTLAGLL